MCLAVFIAAAEPLPFVAWDEAAPAFHLQTISEAESGVRVRFTKPYVYFLGAHTGCSCGFNYGLRDVTSADDHAEEVASQASVTALRAYLRDVVARQGDVEVFSSSSSEEDWDAAPAERRQISPDWFGGERFAMPEQVFFRVTASAVA